MSYKTDLDKDVKIQSPLRNMAENQLGECPETINELKGKTRAAIIHELQVHQID